MMPISCDMSLYKELFNDPISDNVKGTKIYGFWYQSYLQYLQGPSQGLTLLAG